MKTYWHVMYINREWGGHIHPTDPFKRWAPCGDDQYGMQRLMDAAKAAHPEQEFFLASTVVERVPDPRFFKQTVTYNYPPEIEAMIVRAA